MKESKEYSIYEENSVENMLCWSMERVLWKDDKVRESCPNLSVEEIDCKQSQEKVYIPKRNDYNSSWPKWYSKEHKIYEVLNYTNLTWAEEYTKCWRREWLVITKF